MSTSTGGASLWTNIVEARAAWLRAKGSWRAAPTFDASGFEGVLLDDGLVGAHKVVAFAAEDYLGLARHPSVVAAAHQALDQWGAGGGGSRMVTGGRPVHEELEAAIAAWTGCDKAAVFPTRLAALKAILGAFGDAGVTVCTDEHTQTATGDAVGHPDVYAASYKHRDVDHLQSLLHIARGPAVVVSDVVFSLDGDVAPVADIVALGRRYGALLVLDGTHAALGPDLTAMLDGVDVLRTGDLSTFLASTGAFVAGPASFVDLLCNRAGAALFASPLAPPEAAAAVSALRVLSSPEGERLRTRLAHHVEQVAPWHRTPIIPIVLGSAAAAMAASAALLELGVWIPAVGPPDVPEGRARLRVALSAAHSGDHIATLLDALANVRLTQTS
jgi:8-amino-7-oxononanoate synthase